MKHFNQLDRVRHGHKQDHRKVNTLIKQVSKITAQLPLDSFQKEVMSQTIEVLKEQRDECASMIIALKEMANVNYIKELLYDDALVANIGLWKEEALSYHCHRSLVSLFSVTDNHWHDKIHAVKDSISDGFHLVGDRVSGVTESLESFIEMLEEDIYSGVKCKKTDTIYFTFLDFHNLDDIDDINQFLGMVCLLAARHRRSIIVTLPVIGVKEITPRKNLFIL